MKPSGNIIAELRREAGYTQKSLAEALNITDKAISKWERGLSLPDVALLPRLSALLDADIELLLRAGESALHEGWTGLIDLRRFERDMAQMMYDKPMVYYILVHYLLLGVRDICVLGETEGQSWLSWEKLNKLGFRFILNPPELPKKNLIIMHKPCFLFGSDLTHRFQAAMSTERLIKVCPEWDMTPFLFCPVEYAFMYYKNPAYLFDNALRKTLGRGVVCLSLEKPEQISDASNFVRMYQSNTGLAVADIEVIGSSADE